MGKSFWDQEELHQLNGNILLQHDQSLFRYILTWNVKINSFNYQLLLSFCFVLFFCFVFFFFLFKRTVELRKTYCLRLQI